MCSSTPAVLVRLPMDTTAPAQVRSFLAARACPLHHAGVQELARLCVSELVTNAVLHGGAPITCEVECYQSTGMVVRVHDEGPSRPLLQQPAHRDPSRVPAEQMGGRGLALVDLISDCWGVEAAQPEESGKTVWFCLRPSADDSLDPRDLVGRRSTVSPSGPATSQVVRCLRGSRRRRAHPPAST